MARTCSKLILGALTLGLALPAAGCIGKRRKKPGQQAAAKTAAQEPAQPGTPAAAPPTAAAGSPAALITDERWKVAVDARDPAKGAAQPLVTIVEFSDFECPFCSRLAVTMNEVLGSYGDEVRLVFKHYPLPKHEHAEPSAVASVAAHRQGKFWEMHDKLFANQSALAAAEVRGYAEQIGLDMARFDRDIANKQLLTEVIGDFGDGRVLDVDTTPTFYVNGKLYTGAKDAAELKTIIDEEIALAKRVVAAGADRADLYAVFQGVAKDGTGTRPNRDASHRRGEAHKGTNYAISVGEGSPIKGPDDALVTIVAFSNLVCDGCKEMSKTLADVMGRHPADVRLVWRHFSDGSAPAQEVARAAVAAHNQEKFWPLHNALVSSGEAASMARVVQIAESLGLDRAKLTTDATAAATQAKIDRDEAVADTLRGTAPVPFLWINGRIVDARDNGTAADIEALINEEKAKAAAFLAEQKVDKKELYETMRKTWRGASLVDAAESR